MKKLRVIAAAIIRGALLLSPAVAFSHWYWGKTSAMINILASVGVEALFLLVFVLFSVIVQAFKEVRKKSREEQDASAEGTTAAQ